MQSVSLRYSKFLCRSMSLSDSAKKSNSIKNMTRKGQGSIDPWELSATVSSLLMPVLMKTLYVFKYTYICILQYLYSFKACCVTYCSCCFWCMLVIRIFKSLHVLSLLQILNLTLDMISLIQQHWCRSSSFLKSTLKVGKLRIRGERWPVPCHVKRE